MNNILGSSINMPCTLFETITLFDGFLLMICSMGIWKNKISLSRLKRHLCKVDPYRLIKYHFPGRILLMVLLVFQLLEQNITK